MEYAVVDAGSVTELVKKVVEWISSGWRPQGGICTASQDGYTTSYLQAMIRE